VINIFITYFDEAGDDGYPAYSSPQFILSALYMKDENWKSNYELFYQFRKYLKERYNFPVKYEMHTKDFLLNKKPFTNMMSLDDKLSLIKDTCRFLAKKVNVQLVNVVIDKTAIKNSDYNVLDTALTYSVQRIENSIRCEGNERFLIITDEGRVGKMKNTTRRIQKFNYIPSKYNFNSYRKEIQLLIEDPLPKKSDESFFIQACDTVSYLVHLYALVEYNIGNYPKRLPNKIDFNFVKECLDILKDGALNLKASSNNEYGIVCYPKK
jgi:hypothetical protein